MFGKVNIFRIFVGHISLKARKYEEKQDKLESAQGRGAYRIGQESACIPGSGTLGSEKGTHQDSRTD